MTNPSHSLPEPPFVREGHTNIGAIQEFVVEFNKVAKWLQRVRSTWPTARLHQPGGMFAWVPSGGIPARSGNTLRGVECTLYRELSTSTDGRRTIDELASRVEYVYNPLGTAIAGSQYIYTVFSDWNTRIAMVGGASGATVRFKILSTGPFVGETSAYCLTVLGEVMDISCGAAGVAIGDEIVIWDPSSCMFNIPTSILTGMYGTALSMDWGDDSNDYTGTGTGTTDPIPGRDGGISECVADLGSGTGWVSGECWWMVQTLCCGEDIYY